MKLRFYLIATVRSRDEKIHLSNRLLIRALDSLVHVDLSLILVGGFGSDYHILIVAALFLQII